MNASCWILSVLDNPTVLSYSRAPLTCTRSHTLSKKRENSIWLLSPVRDNFLSSNPFSDRFSIWNAGFWKTFQHRLNQSRQPGCSHLVGKRTCSIRGITSERRTLFAGNFGKVSPSMLALFHIRYFSIICSVKRFRSNKWLVGFSTDKD